MSITRKARIPGPDILRGFAALSVITVHLIASSEIDYGSTIALVGSKFTASVTLFFAISAFSLAYSYGDEMFGKTDFRNFYIKRFFRLAPLFYFVLILQSVIIYFDYRKLPTLFEVLMSATFLFNLVPKMQNGFVWAGWSLSIEWIFYLLYPVLFLFSSNRKVVLLLGLLSAFASTSIAGIKAEPTELYMNILTLLIFFVSGFLVFHCLGELGKLRNALGRYSSLISGAIIFLLALFMLRVFQAGGPLIVNVYVTYSLVWIGMISASIIGMPSFINNWFTRFLGEASYSLYLMHAMVIYLAKKAGLFHMVDAIPASGPVKFLIAFSFVSLLTASISYFSFKYIEKPGIQLGRKCLA